MHAHVGPRSAHAPPRMRAPIKTMKAKPPVGKHQAVLATVAMRLRRRVWMTEEDARGYRRRSLLQDNPAGG